MAYTEFDTTLGTVLADVKAAILLSPDWAQLPMSQVLLTTSQLASANNGVLVFTSTAGFPLIAGQTVQIDVGASMEFRRISSISATQIFWTTNTTYAHAAGTNIYNGGVILKTTSSTGGQMVVDLQDQLINDTRIAVGFYRQHDGSPAGGVDRTFRYCFWRESTGMPPSGLIHAIVAADKDWLFVSLEGPRAGEPQAYSGTYGSQRSYVFASAVIPYHVGDAAPAYVVGASQATDSAVSSGLTSYQVHVSRNYADNASWVPGKIMSVNFVSILTGSGGYPYQGLSPDGNFYIFPYVVAEDYDGIRGKLTGFFYAGCNANAAGGSQMGTPQGRVIETGELGVTTHTKYKLLPVCKGDGNISCWGPFGAVSNSSGSDAYQSPIVAVPMEVTEP